MASAGALSCGARLPSHGTMPGATWKEAKQQQERVHWRRRGSCLVQASGVEMVVEAGASFQPELSWEIYAGAAAGVAPFVIAGVEFGKRIAAQRRCKTCGGSGLVKRQEYLFRCNSCGGFLPWQSWSRFFSGR